MTENKNNCLVCNEELVYEKETKEYTCMLCHAVHQSMVSCKNGHFICDDCHSASAYDIITLSCTRSESTNPFEIIEPLFYHPAIKLHGPEHHYLVPAALITAYYNATGQKELLPQKLNEAYKRSKKILGGFCGFYGNCGAGVGTGIFISLITEATPLSANEWQKSNMITSKALYDIAINGGPRCCKRNTILAVYKAVEFVEEHFHVQLPLPDHYQCNFHKLNGQCRKEECLYFPKNTP